MIEVKDLDAMFNEGLEVDKADFSEMRSSLLLIAGEHYNRRNGRVWERIRTSKDLSNETRIRLTKNHMGRINRRYSNTIVSAAPGVVCAPANPKELADTKAAELNNSVWQFLKKQNRFQNKLLELVDDFTGTGEVAAEWYWDEFDGEISGYEPNEMGEADMSKPVYSGKLKLQTIYGFNLIRDPRCQNVEESPWYCVRSMVSVQELKRQFPDQEDKIQPSTEETFMVFDGQSYRQSKPTEAMVKRWFFRPCRQYPKGWFVMQCQREKLMEMELPSSENQKPVFPIVVRRCEYVQTKARGVAMTKPLRPFQAELNRAASKIAETQMTLGDDKLITYGNAKISAGSNLPGIRQVTVNGPEPTIMPGRTGEQYLNYALETIKEMYMVADMEEQEMTQNIDPYALLFRASNQKMKFSRYVQRFESFEQELCEIGLHMARIYFSDDMIIRAVGSGERINIPEFKSSDPLCYQIKLEPQSDDIETKLGRQLTLTNLLQYVGPQLQSQDLGKFLKQMPYANFEEAISDLTIDYEMASNDILAMDRGEEVVPGPADNHEYIIKRLSSRQKLADYKYLHPHIQGLYEKSIADRTQILEQQKQAAIRNNSGFIPDGGTLIGVDYFVQDPKNPERTRRARLPYSAVDWLVQKLQEQGSALQMLNELPPEVQASMGEAAPQKDPMEELAQAEGSQGEIVAPQA